MEVLDLLLGGIGGGGPAAPAPPVVDAWERKAEMPWPGRDEHAAAAANGKAYVFGGDCFSGYIADCDEYNPSTNTWASKADLPTVRGQSAAATVSDKIYVTGGRKSGAPQYFRDCLEFDPVGNDYTPKTLMPVPPRRFHASAALGTKVYITGGYNDVGSVVADCDEFDTVANTWASKADLPLPRYDHAIAGVNGKLYVIGGRAGAVPSADCLEYDPVGNDWSSKTDMPAPARYGLACGIIADKIYVFGGSDDVNNYLVDTDQYSPATDTWTTKEDMIAPGRRRHAGCAIGTKAYALGGLWGTWLQTCDEYTA